MKYRIFWDVIGLVFFAILIPVSVSIRYNYKVYSQGDVVDVIITSLPGNPSTKTGYMHFKMNGKIYIKQVGRAFCNEHHIGDTVRLKYLRGYETHFLFPNESPLSSGILVILLLTSLGIGSFYYAFKKQSFTLPIRRRH